MAIKDKIIVVLDLDDTLYNEIDFLKSAYQEIAYMISVKSQQSSQNIYNEMIKFYTKGVNVFEAIIKLTQVKDITVETLLTTYRHHNPQITLGLTTSEILKYLKSHVYKIGLVTDGRSIQQRNKITALGLDCFLDDIIISEEFGSEKPNVNNFKFYSDKYGEAKYMYVGDNVKKDFIAPKALGWVTVCLLDNGVNIHSQNIALTAAQTPDFKIKNLSDLKQILKAM
ncbi:HAD-IA family hydrolase [Formosa sediminum]|uniref:HAD-IA family hydrolase n=1 Tax=Formosa sediminum TaxID=2594004 RepID=A0A516GS13_9FLAO|nr:HAD family hydrolase [Formosa sediminum]QDO94302.1 HAD-IA family hydrolase [Formosa sediminum]